ncbi:glycosyltransferase [Danxiaibacter flavus]|uniref:Glycosyltransferase n=1 Tax=Danxiaibacter flavus TaxID=3049108 RepID=A0ABV3ZJT5_9BACT|nr:glycosyltransferase [Chitinophagaceae bacterium DXS]
MSTATSNKRVLVAPLDWGLGHATRCIPIIKKLLEAGCSVFIASDGPQLALLKAEFDEAVRYLQLPGYRISYSVSKRFLALKILQQTPKILQKINREHEWLQSVIDQHKIDLVISDNRYGLYSSKVPCIFITHQLNIAAPFNRLRNLIRKINYRFVNKYTVCWVPDTAAIKNISGELSHPCELPRTPVKYIGLLNRLNPRAAQHTQYQWLIVLSGPEPQRTVLEKKLIQLISKLEGKVLLARGKPGSTERLDMPGNCVVANHLTGNEMEEAFASSEFVVSRCGYTTVMELVAFRKKSVLIPTPGQTEQEYLATHLMGQHWAYCCSQDDDLLLHFNNAQSFEYNFPSFNESGLDEAIQELIDN